MLNWILGIVWFVLVVYTLYVLFTGPKPKKFSLIVWLLLILILPLIGVILFWVLEKNILK